MNMIKIFMMFFTIMASFMGLFYIWKLLTKDEKWNLLKMLTLAIICAIIATGVLVGIVILF